MTDWTISWLSCSTEKSPFWWKMKLRTLPQGERVFVKLVWKGTHRAKQKIDKKLKFKYKYVGGAINAGF